MKFELKDKKHRKEVFRKLRDVILHELVSKKRIPYFHILHYHPDGTVDNHYMTPIALTKEKDKMIFIEDYEFFLRILLQNPKVIEVEYDKKEGSIIFTLDECR